MPKFRITYEIDAANWEDARNRGWNSAGHIVGFMAKVSKVRDQYGKRKKYKVYINGFPWTDARTKKACKHFIKSRKAFYPNSVLAMIEA